MKFDKLGLVFALVFIVLGLGFVMAEGELDDEDYDKAFTSPDELSPNDFTKAVQEYLGGREVGEGADLNSDEFKTMLADNFYFLTPEERLKVLTKDMDGMKDYSGEDLTELMNSVDSLESDGSGVDKLSGRDKLLADYMTKKRGQIHEDKEPRDIEFNVNGEGKSLKIDDDGNLVGKNGAVINLGKEEPKAGKLDLRLDPRVKKVEYDEASGMFKNIYAGTEGGEYLEMSWDKGQFTRDGKFVRENGKAIEDVNFHRTRDSENSDFKKVVKLTSDGEGNVLVDYEGSTKDPGVGYSLPISDGLKEVTDPSLKEQIAKGRQTYLTPDGDVAGGKKDRNSMRMKIGPDGEMAVAGNFVYEDLAEGVQVREATLASEGKEDWRTIEGKYDNPHVTAMHEIQKEVETRLTASGAAIVAAEAYAEAKNDPEEALKKTQEAMGAAWSNIMGGGKKDVPEAGADVQAKTESVTSALTKKYKEAGEALRKVPMDVTMKYLNGDNEAVSKWAEANKNTLGANKERLLSDSDVQLLKNNPILERDANGDSMLSGAFETTMISRMKNPPKSEFSEPPGENTIRYVKSVDPLGETQIDLGARTDSKWSRYDVSEAKGNVRNIDVRSTAGGGNAFVVLGESAGGRKSYVKMSTTKDSNGDLKYEVDLSRGSFKSDVSVLNLVDPKSGGTWGVKEGGSLYNKGKENVNVWAEQRYVSGYLAGLGTSGFENRIASRKGVRADGVAGGAVLKDMPDGSIYVGDAKGNPRLETFVDPYGVTVSQDRGLGFAAKKGQESVTGEAFSKKVSTGTVAENFETSVINGFNEQMGIDPQFRTAVEMVTYLDGQGVDRAVIRNGLEANFGMDKKTSGSLMDAQWIITHPVEVESAFERIDGMSSTIGYQSAGRLMSGGADGKASFSVGSESVPVPNQLANVLIQGAYDRGPQVKTQTPHEVRAGDPTYNKARNLEHHFEAVRGIREPIKLPTTSSAKPKVSRLNVGTTPQPQSSGCRRLPGGGWDCGR
jgi:hypothetical protein